MKKPNTVNSFLVEIIIVMLFFSLCLAITLNLFFQAYKDKKENENINIAFVKIQEKAEEFKNIKETRSLKLIYKEAQVEQIENKTTFMFSYNQDWQLSSKDEFYKIIVVIEQQNTQAGTMLKATFTAQEKEQRKTISEIQTKKYLPIKKEDILEEK